MVPYSIWTQAVSDIYETRQVIAFRLTSYNFDASCVTCGDHILVLRSITTFGREDVRDRLIIRPPLRALDVLLRRAH